MRDAERIEREERPAIDQHADQQQGKLALAEQCGQASGDAAYNSHPHDHHAPVEPVGQPADRILKNKRAEDWRCHEIADLAAVESDGQAIDSSHAEQHRHRHTVQPEADHGKRRDLQQAADTHPLRLFKIWRAGRGQQHRYDGDRHQHRRQDEKRHAVLCAGRDHHLPDAEAAHRDNHVERQHLAAGLVGRFVVQPAFADDIHAGETEAGDNPHHRPDGRMDEDRDHQHSRRGQRRHRAEDPHMADIVEKFGHQQRAEENAKEVAGHHKAGCDFGKARPGRLDAEQNDLKPVAGHDQQQAKKQSP